MKTGIHWRLAAPPEATTEYAGTKLGAYYTNGEVMLETQIIARDKFHSLYGVSPIGICADTPAYIGVAALGAELVYPEDDPPMIRGCPLQDVSDVENVELPSSGEYPYYNTPAMSPYLRIYEWMKRTVGDNEKVGLGAGVEGPITSAKLLRGQDFFSDLYDNPRAAHRLLDIVTESFVRFVKENRRIQGAATEGGGVGIADDFAGLISPTLWPRFVTPYYRRIYEAFDPGPRSMHSELLRPGHLKFLEEIGVTSFDPGQDQYLTVKQIKETSSINFVWNLFTIRDMLEGTPESIRRTYAEAVEDGARAIMAELCRGMPVENVEAFIAVAKEYE